MDLPTTGSAPPHSTTRTARAGTERVSRPSPIAANQTLALPARAKLNLDLRIIGRTPDGFHELASTMQAIALHDLLEMIPATETSLTCSGIDVRPTQENSVLKAHAALERAAQKRLPTRFHLDKRIPPGSGMGGASSDAAATLLGMRALYQLREVDLAPIAAEVGADVAFFLRGGRAKAQGRGERLTPIHNTDEEWFA